MNHRTTETGGNGPADLVVGWLDGQRIGTLLRSGALTLAPVYGGETSTPVAYRTLAEGLARGEVLVSERMHASVGALQVQNHGALPLLILDGEEVVGGLQNRVVNTTLLIPATTTFDLPVSCIEHGRWREVKATFDAGQAVHPTLRREKAEQVTASLYQAQAPISNQHAIWAEVEARHRQTGTRSPTGALGDAYHQRAPDLNGTLAELACPVDGPTGVVAFSQGRAACADLFDRPASLQHYWQRLVRSYALESIDEPLFEPSGESAERLLKRPARATRTAFDSLGVGTDVRIRGNGVVGAALVHAGSIVHVALFRQTNMNAHANMRSPRERARRATENDER
jgi:hypothetical protein